MATSKKIVKSNNKIDIITTNYPNSFIGNRNNKGRRKHDFESMEHEQFKKCLNQKRDTLGAYKRQLDFIGKNNDFNYFITIRGINRSALNLFTDRTRKADKQLQYVILASWSMNMDLHYHILIKTELSKEQLQSKLKQVDYDIKIITDQIGVIDYFKKNLNYDTIHILKQVDNTELRHKQIEILNYSKVLNYSRGIHAKPETIKNPSQEQIQEIYDKSTYVETIKYPKLDSNVEIDKFED